MEFILGCLIVLVLPLTLVAFYIATIELFSNKGRFSLSWLLITTTLVAVGLGLLVATTRLD
jgi:hypothetical protein